MAMKITCAVCGAEWPVERWQYDPSYLRCPNGCDAPEAAKRELSREEAVELALDVYQTAKGKPLS